MVTKLEIAIVFTANNQGGIFLLAFVTVMPFILPTKEIQWISELYNFQVMADAIAK